jgi:hypothetical protein
MRFVIAVAAGALLPIAARAIPVDNYVKVQPIQVCDDSGNSCAPLNLDEGAVQKVFNRAGIGVAFAPVVQYDASAYRYPQISSAGDPADPPHQLLRTYQQQNSGADPQTLNLFFVDKLTRDDGGSVNGYGLYASNGAIVDNTAPIDTPAHEIAHNLGLAHADGNDGTGDPLGLGPALTLNLMNSLSRTAPYSSADITPDGVGTDQLVASQVATAREPLFTVQGASAVASENPLNPTDCTTAGTSCEFQVVVPTAPGGQTLDGIEVRFTGQIPVEASLSYYDAVFQSGNGDGFGTRQCDYTASSTTTAGGFGTQVAFSIPDGCFGTGDNAPLDLYLADESGFEAPLSFEFDFSDGVTSTALYNQTTGRADSRLDSTWSITGPTHPSPGFVAPQPGDADRDFTLDPRLAPQSVPEPASAAVLLTAMGLLAGKRRRATA